MTADDKEGREAGGTTVVAQQPSEVILRLMAERGLNQIELAKRLGTSRVTVNLLVNGKRAISRDVSRRLGSYFGYPADHFLRLQFEWDTRRDQFRQRDQRDRNFQDEPLRGNIEAEIVDFGLATGRAAPTYVLKPGLLVDHAIERARQENLLSISPYSPQLVQPASYDLTFGDHLAVTDRSDIVDLKTLVAVELNPGQTANVETLEELALSNLLMGRVGLSSTLARKSIYLSHGIQCDPGYKGRLFVSLHNHGREKFVIRHGAPFLTIEFTLLEDAPHKSYQGEYQGKRTLTQEDAQVVSADQVIATEVDSDTWRLELAPSVGFRLREPLEIPIERLGNKFIARVPFLDMESVGSHPEEACWRLASYMIARIHFLRENRATLGSRSSELSALEDLIDDNVLLGQEQVSRLAERLGAAVISAGGMHFAEIRDMSGVVIADFPLFDASDALTLDHLARRLDISRTRCLLLVQGKAGLPDYLAWLNEAQPT